MKFPHWALTLTAVAGIATLTFMLLIDSAVAPATTQPAPVSVPVWSGETFVAGPDAPVHDIDAAFVLLKTTSLADVDIPQSIATDTQGNLVTNEGLRELMDFFLALDGELSVQQIRQLFAAAAQAQCNAQCARDALALFDRYLVYLDDMQAARHEWTDDATPRERLDAVIGTRRQLLGDELAQALFGYDEQYDQFRIAQWEIHHDSTLSPQEKADRMRALTAEQPADLQERDQASAQFQQLQQLHKSGPDDAALRFAARADLVGTEAAERLQQLDQQRAQWQLRYQDYRAELNRLLAADISTADQTRQIEQLRLRHFDEQESQRAAALDRIYSASLP